MDSERLWIYSRKSRALGDPDDPELLAAHRSAMLALAQRRGVTVPPGNVVLEVGSGETIAERPSFSHLLQTWEALPPSAGGAVLTPAVDRLSRGSLMEQARVQTALARASIAIWTPSRDYDLSDLDEQFLFDVESLFARRELSLFKKRQAAKRAELLKSGRSANLVPPYPYMVDRLNRSWLPHPARFLAAQSWCREIYTASLRTIARRWGVSTEIVHQTLRNGAIAGWPHRQYVKENGKVRKLTAEERADPRYWPERQGDYPPVVTLEEWHRIQEVLDNRRIRRAKTGTDDNGWCRDVLRFVGYPDLQPSLSVGPRMANCGGARPRTYQAKPPGHTWLYVERALVHDAALSALARIFARPDLLRSLIANYLATRAVAETGAVHRATVADLDKQITAARRRMDRLGEADLLTDDAEVLASNARLRDRTAASIKALRQQLQETEKEVTAIPALDQVLESLGDALPRLQEALEEMVQAGDCTGLRGLVDAFLSRIWVEVRLRPGMTRRQEREVVGVEFTLPGLEDH